MKPKSSQVFESLPLIQAQQCSSCIHSYSRTPIPHFHPKVKNCPKCQIFILLSNQWFNFKIRFYSSILIQGYARFPKQSSGYQVIKVSRKPRWNSLSRRTWFLTTARLEILTSPLDSWSQNESRVTLGFWFRVPIGLTRKTMQT